MSWSRREIAHHADLLLNSSLLNEGGVTCRQQVVALVVDALATAVHDYGLTRPEIGLASDIVRLDILGAGLLCMQRRIMFNCQYGVAMKVKEGRALAIVVNKMDAVPESARKEVRLFLA